MPAILSTLSDQRRDNVDVPQVPGTIGLYEMTLEVHDLAASERFYTEVVGLPVVERWGEDRPAVWVAMGGKSFLGLWTREAGGAKALHNARGGAHVHFAIRVPYGTLRIYEERWTALGVPWEAIDFSPGNRAIYADDPDGNVVELTEFATLWDGSSGVE